MNEWHGIACDEQGGVTKIVLVQNNIIGVLNESIGNLFALQRLQLQFGKIGGVIPSSIGNLKTSSCLGSLTTSLKERYQPRWGI